MHDFSEENPGTIFRVKRRKRISKRWILILIALLIIIAVIIVITIKLSTRRKSSIFVDINEKKVIFIIVDGIPADVIENSTIPNMKRIGQYKRAYTAGDLGTYTQTVTISAPGYMNVLTGTWGNKHNVSDNAVNYPNYNYKNIFRLFKEEQPNKKIGIFSTWTDNRVKLLGENLSNAGNLTFDYKFDGYELDEITYPHDSSSEYIKNIDQRVANETANCIHNTPPDLSWVYLQYTDDVGHQYGDSQQFYQSINNLDQLIGQIYTAVEYRMKNHREDWLVVVTTDHGRDSQTGKHHGGQSERERTVWMITNYRETNHYFENNLPAAVDILPTMARFVNLQIPLQSNRELDGVSFIGDISIIKPNLTLTGDQLTIQWISLEKKGNVKIWLSTTNSYRDGLTDDYKHIGTASAADQMAVFNIREYPSNFYKIVLEGQYNMINRWIYRS